MVRASRLLLPTEDKASQDYSVSFHVTVKRSQNYHITFPHR